MKGLLKSLPPFAPDYSGVSSLFFTLGGAIIINGADGCIGNVTGYDEPRFFDYQSYIFSSGLRETQAITGDEEVLREKIEKSLLKGDLNFILILGTPNSAVIASDHESVSSILSEGRRIPVFTVNTTGIDSYEKGAARAFLALAKKADFFPPPDSGQREGVNLLGATPMDFWGQEQILEIGRTLESRGVGVNSCWGMDNSWESIRGSLRARSNLVVSSVALKAAALMQKDYGMPFHCGVPLPGFSETLIAEIHRGGSEAINLRPPGKGKKVWILGEQIWSASLRQALLNQQPALNIRCLSFFEQDKTLKRGEDCRLHREDELSLMALDEKPDLVIGDPLYQALTQNRPFYGIPHLAVSSRLYWDHNLPYTGDAMDLDAILSRL